MKLNKYLFVLSLLILGGCNSESDDVSITNNYAIEPEEIAQSNEQNKIGDFILETMSETDFFVIAKGIDSLERYYSNSNAFHFDNTGYLVNNSGYPLLVYPVNSDGSSASVSISVSEPIKIDYKEGDPKATDRVDVSANLPKNDNELLSEEFSNQNPLTYNHSTSVSVFDSIGGSHVLTFYFINISVDDNTWELKIALDGNTTQPVIAQILDFSPSGFLDINDDDLDGSTTTNNGLLTSQNIQLNNGANDLDITLDFTTGTTSLDSSFEISLLETTGFYTDSLKEFKIDSDGLVTLSYVHGEDKLLGRVALAKFNSPYNLDSLGNSLWSETNESGAAAFSESGRENFGTLMPITYDY